MDVEFLSNAVSRSIKMIMFFSVYSVHVINFINWLSNVKTNLGINTTWPYVTRFLLLIFCLGFLHQCNEWDWPVICLSHKFLSNLVSRLCWPDQVEFSLILISLEEFLWGWFLFFFHKYLIKCTTVAIWVWSFVWSFKIMYSTSLTAVRL